MDAEKARERLGAQTFGEEAYRKTPRNRAYALTPQAQIALSALASAMFKRRIAEGRSGIDDKPTSWQEFFEIIHVLADAGCNVLQARPGDTPPLPQVWRDPVTNAALPNPFEKKSADLKAQSILTRRDPALAAHYKAMAEDPYGTIAKMMDVEVNRRAMEEVPYTESEHAVNPFRTDDQTAHATFVKNATPQLVEFCKSEAKDVSIPIFGPNRNLTIEGRLIKDPAVGALVKVARQIYENWKAEDKAVAQAQRAAAEEALRKLAVA
jgi:hypothetical protein